MPPRVWLNWLEKRQKLALLYFARSVQCAARRCSVQCAAFIARTLVGCTAHCTCMLAKPFLPIFSKFTNGNLTSPGSDI